MPLQNPARFGAWLLAVGCALAAAVHAAPANRWTIQDVGAFGNVGSDAWDINNRGDVVGTSSKMLPGRIAPISRCFLWQNGVMQDIGTPFVPQLGTTGDFCHALAINDRGTILAHTGYGDEVFLFRDGEWAKVGNGVGYGINRSEDVVGQYWNGSASHGFLIRDGIQHDLGTLGGPISSANAINDKGVVVGLSELPQSGVVHAIVYKDGEMRDLGTLGGEDSVATDINDRGQIVGYTGTTFDDLVAFIADENGNMRKLFDVPGTHYANGINDRGAVVGVVNNKGFLYDDGVLTILDDIPQVSAAGWTRLVPKDINDRGWITGVGTHNGQRVAFVLIPR